MSKPKERPLSRLDVLNYEARVSWWLPMLCWDWGPRMTAVVAQYFAWKTRRKYDRYMQAFREEREMQEDPEFFP